MKKKTNMQTIDEVKEHSAECWRGIVAAVTVVILLAAFSGMAGEAADRKLSEFAGIDVSTVQTNKAMRIVLPNPLGPFKEGTLFADKTGRIHQIRCVTEYPKDVRPEVVVKTVEELRPCVERMFNCKCLGSKEDRSTVRRWRFVPNGLSGCDIQTYVAESKRHGMTNGCYVAGLTVFRGNVEGSDKCLNLKGNEHADD